MLKRLLTYSVESLVEMGRRILVLLEAVPRLAGPAARLRTAQELLEAKHTTWRQAVEAARQARAARDESRTALANLLREFALALLALTGNNYSGLLFRRYFPDNYHVVVALGSAEIAAFARQVLAMLAEEPNARLPVFRDRIAAARDAVISAEALFRDRQEDETEAFGIMEAQKLEWVRGLTASKLEATEILYGEPGELRRIYGAAMRPRRPAPADEPAPEEVVEPPDIGSAPGAARPPGDPQNAPPAGDRSEAA